MGKQIRVEDEGETEIGTRRAKGCESRVRPVRRNGEAGEGSCGLGHSSVTRNLGPANTSSHHHGRRISKPFSLYSFSGRSSRPVYL